MEEGFTKFRDWAADSPNNVFRQVMAYRCLEDDYPEEAFTYLERAIALDAKNPLVLMTRVGHAFGVRQFEGLNDLLDSWKAVEPWGFWLTMSGVGRCEHQSKGRPRGLRS